VRQLVGSLLADNLSLKHRVNAWKKNLRKLCAEAKASHDADRALYQARTELPGKTMFGDDRTP
jgi:hypothetical protein